MHLELAVLASPPLLSSPNSRRFDLTKNQPLHPTSIWNFTNCRCVSMLAIDAPKLCRHFCAPLLSLPLVILLIVCLLPPASPLPIVVVPQHCYYP